MRLQYADESMVTINNCCCLFTLKPVVIVYYHLYQQCIAIHGG